MMQGELPGGDGMRKAARSQFDWKGSIETLEDRRVMSADPLLQSVEHHHYEEDDVSQIEHQLVSEPDFWLDVDNLTGIEDQLNQIEQTLYSAHNTTGLNSVVSNYGFTGIGQTVAVIDSGIAYDHFALGGGLGANYRVVGGWDFTAENDANPYDDGPSGSHGTHVAGIVGGSAGQDKGVAPGVDLVALRVFDDAGNGYFSWVENARRWVIQNRNSFENPITAINLSLGVSSWNSNTIPSWSTLEDEFAQLETAGVFIAVSAGNSYASYNSPGLGYPAASPYVVPVMSVTDAGVLAGYSQRDTRAIAAPGSGIRSTVPDYKGNNNGIADDYASFSGTSMASPYIAGASVLIRQAMEFVGRTNITQDMIYDHMMATGTSFVDSSTGLTFKRLNLGAAITALMPTDDYGSTTGTAFNLGSLNAAKAATGVISTLSDVDYFKFTATTNGRVSLAVSDTRYGMDAAWTMANGTGTLSNSGDTFSFDVVAGQTYTVGLSSSGGLGYYDLDVTMAEQLPSVPLMTLKSSVHNNGDVYSLDSDGWISINNNRVWENTRDFSLGSDGSVYWLGCTGQLAQRQANGQWKTLDSDAIKFALDNSGRVYSVGADGWVNVNGGKVWENTADFAIASDQSICWQSTSGDLYRRSTTGSWSLVDRNVVEMAVGSNSVVYALRTNNWVSFNGSAVWENSFDIMCAADNSIYWHSTNGTLYVKPNGGPWQQISANVNQFAMRQDGLLYTLTYDGNVQAGGSTLCSGVSAFTTDNFGQLVLQLNNGSQHELGGRYTSSSNMVAAYSAGQTQSFSAYEGLAIGGLVANLNHDLAFEAIGLENGHLRVTHAEYDGLRAGISSVADPYWDVAMAGFALTAPTNLRSATDTFENGIEAASVADESAASLISNGDAIDFHGLLLEQVVGSIGYGVD
jgi:subtilisin family serine protease